MNTKTVFYNHPTIILAVYDNFLFFALFQCVRFNTQNRIPFATLTTLPEDRQAH